MPIEVRFQCAGCGEWNETVLDESAGRLQGYCEICQFCSGTNLLGIRRDSRTGKQIILSELER